MSDPEIEYTSLSSAYNSQSYRVFFSKFYTERGPVEDGHGPPVIEHDTHIEFRERINEPFLPSEIEFQSRHNRKERHILIRHGVVEHQARFEHFAKPITIVDTNTPDHIHGIWVPAIKSAYKPVHHSSEIA